MFAGVTHEASPSLRLLQRGCATFWLRRGHQAEPHFLLQLLLGFPAGLATQLLLLLFGQVNPKGHRQVTVHCRVRDVISFFPLRESRNWVALLLAFWGSLLLPRVPFPLPNEVGRWGGGSFKEGFCLPQRGNQALTWRAELSRMLHQVRDAKIVLLLKQISGFSEKENRAA